MSQVRKTGRPLLLGLAVACGALLPAQELTLVKNLLRTVGSASKARPLMFCTIPDGGIIPPAYDAAAKEGRRPFVIGWELTAPPPQLAMIVLVTNLSPTGDLAGAACKRVQPMPPGGADAMQLDTPYAAVDKASDWTSGYTMLVMTAKSEALPDKDYVSRLKRHVSLVTRLFEPHGLDGYLVYAGKDFEWAYLHWVDQETSIKAFATPEGKTGPADSASFQHRRGTIVQIFPGNLGK